MTTPISICELFITSIIKQLLEWKQVLLPELTSLL